jgi:hypothetical protein
VTGHGTTKQLYKEFAKQQGVIDYRLAHFMKRIKQVTDASGAAERKRFEETLALFDPASTRVIRQYWNGRATHLLAVLTLRCPGC